MDINDLKNAERICNRINKLGDDITNLISEHGYNTKSFTWTIEDDTINLRIESAIHENDSCGCHPNYIISEHTTYHYIPISEILDDLYYFDDCEEYDEDKTSDEHPFIQRLKAEIAEKKKKEAEEREWNRLLEEERKETEKKRRELQEYERLQKMYGSK